MSAAGACRRFMLWAGGGMSVEKQHGPLADQTGHAGLRCVCRMLAGPLPFVDESGRLTGWVTFYLFVVDGSEHQGGITDQGIAEQMSSMYADSGPPD